MYICKSFSSATTISLFRCMMYGISLSLVLDGWMNQAYSRLSTTHGHITDCKLLVCMYWTRLVGLLVRPVASLYSAY